MNIGKNIKTIRKSKKMTLKELGAKVKLSEQAIGQYERGDRNPSIEILKEIAIALDVSINSLIDDKEAINKQISENYYEKLIEIIGICYQKAKDEIEVNAIENFIMSISKLKKDSQLELIELLEDIDEIKAKLEGMESNR